MKISVITPSYNQVNYVEETILSVLNQTYNNIEYIIIDGNSNDGSQEVINRYHHLISHFISEEDEGQADAINKGLKLATGDICCWINSDDLFYDNTTLHTIVDIFKNNVDIDIVFGAGLLFKNNETIGHCIPSNFSYDLLLKCDPLQQPSVFWRKSIQDKISLLNQELHYTLDWEYFIRLFKVGNFVYSNHIFSRYRIHDAHKTKNGGLKRGEEILRIVRNYSDKEIIAAYTSVFDHLDLLLKFKSKFKPILAIILFLIFRPTIFIKHGFNVIYPLRIF